MAEIEEVPRERVRNIAYQRAQQVLMVIRELRQGGTAFDVREKLIDMTGDRISVGPVKESLWHLEGLGLVLCEEIGTSRWWTATFQTTTGSKNDSRASC